MPPPKPKSRQDGTRARTSFKNPNLMSEATKQSNHMSFKASFNRDNSKEGGKTYNPGSN